MAKHYSNIEAQQKKADAGAEKARQKAIDDAEKARQKALDKELDTRS